MDKKTFTDWCFQFGIAKEKAASLSEAAGITETDTFTEIQFRKMVPMTVEDWLRVTSSIKAAEREEFCGKYGFKLADEIDEETFKEAVKDFAKSKETTSSPSTEEGALFKVLSPIRIGGERYEPGSEVNLSTCSAQEIARLKAKRVI